MGIVTLKRLKITNFEINKGDIVALVGPSGLVKSFLNYGRCFTNTDIWAHILINNQDITTMSEKALAKVRMSEIGFYFTSYNLYHF